MKTLTLTLLILFTALSIQSQPINQVDAKGFKQGAWKVTYENGQTKYEGTFKDNKPVGLMKRYYDDGTLKAEMLYMKDNKSHAKLYFNNGVLAGEGNYTGNLKDSVWNYYSYYTTTLRLSECYANGIKNGQSIRVYNNGVKSEITTWINNQKEGQWLQYFENGNKQTDASYKNDKREGKFTSYYPDGKIETAGNFVNDNMHGEWVYYLPDGSVQMKINYIKGIAQESEELKKKNKELFDLIEKNKGKIPEPDETNFNQGQ